MPTQQKSSQQTQRAGYDTQARHHTELPAGLLVCVIGGAGVDCERLLSARGDAHSTGVGSQHSPSCCSRFFRTLGEPVPPLILADVC